MNDFVKDGGKEPDVLKGVDAANQRFKPEISTYSQVLVEIQTCV